MKEKAKKEKKDLEKKILTVLLVLLILVIILIPFLYFAEVKKALPILFFIVIPVIAGGLIVYLSRNCVKDYKNKKKQILLKLNK